MEEKSQQSAASGSQSGVKGHCRVIQTWRPDLLDNTLELVLKTHGICVSFSSLGLVPEFDQLDKGNPNCVVLGEAADNFSYQNLNEAFRVLIGLENPILLSLGRG